ncbi:branched-chain amino acid transport system permease protein [Allocatelliglobosispora scoriae]|uniref:Branched-chain amino acid transport system permease protein n=1 Tax=Allocatelliglobosispora scoriae TaxID=643052 RepID=A0A841BZW2_9ACTN|nr:branched-chain amino acid ABC transporter permease [Allocatelliglobosispora scoriae]MBB5872639.1 branched-chain amino acid transport system permease protein [Allocatelliglobosispora scoriae]
MTMPIRSTLLRHLLYTLAGAGVLLAVTSTLEPFRSFQLATVAAYFCATAGLTVLTGLNGQLSLGHGALMAVGAYTVAIAQNMLSDEGFSGGWLLPVSLLAAVLTTVIAGLVIGLAAARLRGPYLAGVTLAVAVTIPALTTAFDEVFNSDQGLSVYLDPPPASLGLTFPLERWQAWIALGTALIVALLLANLVHSRYGRTLRAVRDNEVAARLAGINVARTQVSAFVVSAACAGLGGGLLAVVTQSVSPGAYSLTLSLFLLMAVVVGGLGSLTGAVWGALLLVVLPDLTHTLTEGLSPSAAQRLEGNLSLAVFGLTLIVVMIAAPGGIQGLFRKLTGARS